MTGCVEQVNIQKQEPLRLFNREYYAVKNLTRADVRKMNQLMTSDDKSAAMTAGLILGRHYVRNGELEKGYKLLAENLDDSYLDRFSKISGHLWMYDAALKSEKMDVADTEKEYLQNVEMDAKAEKAFRHYCAQERKELKKGTIKDCALLEKPAGETEINIEIIDEEKPKKEIETKHGIIEKVKVKIENAEADTKFIEAMLYSISKLELDMELDFTGDKMDYDFVFDVKHKIVRTDNAIYEFKIDMAKVFDEAVNLALLNGAYNLVLGYTDELFEKVLEIEEKYKDSDINIYKFSITDPGFQATLKTVKQQVGEDKTISFVVAGSEKQLVKIVPFLRFYSDKPDKTILVNAVNGFGKLFFNSEYIEYFKKSYVVSDVILLGKAEIERFNEEYFNDYTSLPEIKDMLGHDIIVFMQKTKNPSYIGEYLTGITDLEEGRTVRKTDAYKIVTTKKIRKLVN
jgi:hypothetical protein